MDMKQDLAAALHHLDRLACPVDDPHRLALEAILLRLIVQGGRAADQTQVDPPAEKVAAVADSGPPEPPRFEDPCPPSEVARVRNPAATLRMLDADEARARAMQPDPHSQLGDGGRWGGQERRWRR